MTALNLHSRTESAPQMEFCVVEIAQRVARIKSAKNDSLTRLSFVSVYSIPLPPVYPIEMEIITDSGAIIIHWEIIFGENHFTIYYTFDRFRPIG